MTSDPKSPANNVPEYSVSEISSALKQTVEGAFRHVRVRGEISGFKRPASGHLYMDLKDDKAVLNGVCWKGVAAKLRFQPEDGLEVVAIGKISTYAPRSNYQLIIESMEPAGAGALMALLEQRKKQLAAEGLFAAERKQSIPALPDVIGVITSPTGAVIRDILHRLADRFPRHVLLWPVRVQGEGAAEELAAAIEGFNALALDGAVPRPDVLIVARGGGSLEDLWAFNEEVVVRAAAASQIPLISAVGHETDTTLIDYASDRRAPTPTAAAEMAVPVRADLLFTVQDYGARLTRLAGRLVQDRKDRVTGLARGLPTPQEILGLKQQRFDELAQRLPRALEANTAAHRRTWLEVSAGLRPNALQRHVQAAREGLPKLVARLGDAHIRLVQRKSDQMQSAGRLLESLSYQAVLKRGYTVVRDAGGKVTQTAAQKSGATLDIEFADGHTPVVVASGPARKTTVKKPAAKSVRKTSTGQGDLF